MQVQAKLEGHQRLRSSWNGRWRQTLEMRVVLEEEEVVVVAVEVEFGVQPGVHVGVTVEREGGGGGANGGGTRG